MLLESFVIAEHKLFFRVVSFFKTLQVLRFFFPLEKFCIVSACIDVTCLAPYWRTFNKESNMDFVSMTESCLFVTPFS